MDINLTVKLIFSAVDINLTIKLILNPPKNDRNEEIKHGFLNLRHPE